jgi:hypothetical protein
MSEQLHTPVRERFPDPERDPRPADDTFIYHGAEFTRLNQDRDIFSQLEETAREQGNPGMVGLEWIQADGLRYRVSSHEKLTRTKQEGKKSLIPKVVVHPVTGPELLRKETYTPVTEEVDYRTVDVLNEDGELVDVLTFIGSRREWIPDENIGPVLLERATGIPQGEYKTAPRDRFEEHFYVGAHINPASPGAQIKVPREIFGFRWTERQETGTSGRGTIAAPEIDDWDTEARLAPESPEDMKRKTPQKKTRELFEAIAEQQLELGLDSWYGLTWSTPFPTIDKDTRSWKRDNPAQMQIIRDMVIIRNASDPEKSYPERAFEVRTRADGITTNRHIYTLDELMLQFSRREARERKARAATGPGSGLADERGPELNLRWELPGPAPRGKSAEEKGPQTTEITDSEIEELHKAFDTDLTRVGVDLFKGEDSLGWFRDYMISVSSGGRAVLENSEEGQEQRSYIINFILGSRFNDFALKRMEKPSRKRGGKDTGEEEKPEKDKKFIGVVNPKAMHKIRKLLFINEIREVLGIEKDTKLIELDSIEDETDLVELGRLIRLSLGET